MHIHVSKHFSLLLMKECMSKSICNFLTYLLCTGTLPSVLHVLSYWSLIVILWASSSIILKMRRLGFREIYLLKLHSISPSLVLITSYVDGCNSFVFGFLVFFLNPGMTCKLISEHGQWEWGLTISNQYGHTNGHGRHSSLLESVLNSSEGL